MIDLERIQDRKERARLVLHEILRPALRDLKANDGFPGDPDNKMVQVNLLAISGQEADWKWRAQLSRATNKPNPNGPALGLWQFEKGGGVAGVMTHPSSARFAKAISEALGLPFERETSWRQLMVNDEFAAAYARLLYWTDPYAVPTTAEAGWTAYRYRLWRPGSPHPDAWPANYNIAFSAVNAN